MYTMSISCVRIVELHSVMICSVCNAVHRPSHVNTHTLQKGGSSENYDVSVLDILLAMYVHCIHK